jgi:hypothetical protein
MQVLESEKIIGIKTFFTPYEGTYGKLSTVTEDFNVNEISN